MKEKIIYQTEWNNLYTQSRWYSLECIIYWSRGISFPSQWISLMLRISVRELIIRSNYLGERGKNTALSWGDNARIKQWGKQWQTRQATWFAVSLFAFVCEESGINNPNSVITLRAAGCVCMCYYFSDLRGPITPLRHLGYYPLTELPLSLSLSLREKGNI